MWLIVIALDLALDFRLEFLWPCWMFLKRIFESFKYKNCVSRPNYLIIYCRINFEIMVRLKKKRSVSSVLNQKLSLSWPFYGQKYAFLRTRPATDPIIISNFGLKPFKNIVLSLKYRCSVIVLRARFSIVHPGKSISSYILWAITLKLSGYVLGTKTKSFFFS